jgi:hypothetical protein
MAILGREPTLWIGVATSIVMVIGTLGLGFLNGEQAALVVVAINALAGALNAYTVRPVAPAVFTYAVGSIIAVAAAYGLNLPTETVASINALVIPMLALLTRGQVSPEDTAVSASTGAAIGDVVTPPASQRGKRWSSSRTPDTT